MNAGIERTLEFLTSTENEAAVGVLVPALDANDRHIQECALRALLDRRSQSGQREVLRRLDPQDGLWMAILAEKQGRLSQALRDAVLGADRQLCETACQVACSLQEYDLMPTLINAIESENNPHLSLLADCVVSLADQLYRELAGPRDYSNRRDPQLVRRNLVASLEQSLERFSRHQRAAVLEAFLLLANRDNSTLKKILLDPHDAAYLSVVEILTHSQRPGVLRLLLTYLDDPHPPHSALNVVAHRMDLPFIQHLLKKVGFEPARTMAQNLRQLESAPWLLPESRILDQLNDAEQHSAVQLLTATKIRRDDVVRTLAHLLQHGRPQGRRAAIEALSGYQGVDANQLALSALTDEDPLVQAGAIRQLRHRGIPGALPRLLKLVDSPHEAVRQAVRESLTEFSFDRYLSTFDMLEADVRRSTGKLVLKIDPEAVRSLHRELHSRTRTGRMRALAMTVAMSAERHMESDLIVLLRDEDHMLRSEAARALAACNSPNTRRALTQALTDSSIPVQEAATRSLEELESRKGRAKAGDQERRAVTEEAK